MRRNWRGPTLWWNKARIVGTHVASQRLRSLVLRWNLIHRQRYIQGMVGPLISSSGSQCVSAGGRPIVAAAPAASAASTS